MQLFQLLTLAFAATAMAKVHDDNIPIPDSVEGPSDSVFIEADTFGTAVTAASAKLRRKVLETRASRMTNCEHQNFRGSCRTVGSIQSGVCYNINGIWNDVISSTDTHGSTCTFWEHQGCRGDQSTINGRYNWEYMNDKISSYRCFE